MLLAKVDITHHSGFRRDIGSKKAEPAEEEEEQALQTSEAPCQEVALSVNLEELPIYPLGDDKTKFGPSHRLLHLFLVYAVLSRTINLDNCLY